MQQVKRPSISDVAKLANVSKQTVSRVINESPNVSDKTRQCVLQAIADLGFRRSEVARSFSQGRTYSLGVVGRNLIYFGTSTYIGIARQAETLGYSLLLKELPDSSIDQIEPMLHALLDRQVDGIVWAIPEISDNHAWLDTELFDQIPVPIVFLSMAPHPKASVVAYDNFVGGMQATQHLLECGRQHIGHITGPLDWWDASERRRGWEAALQQTGRPVLPNHMVTGNWDAASGEAAFHRLLENYPEMDAVFVSNDKMALGVLLAAHDKGLRIPEDLAVIGFDDITESAYFHPPLTTVLQNKPALGQLAVKTLVHKIEEKFQTETQTALDSEPLVHQLIVRKTTLMRVP
ncbi:MAG: LacI family DNA-binding transcriptional regulator [Rouxiella aceris]|uniref:LacI family DNA-binding transcriptional regulator n=1 Tax=Rouxiella aceris TaxID=2703884 RepID=UPI002850EAA0|nr:LacI family DNA-binding transcriptional regulator [Rouxiella aceris]MDR3434772.1 LacI family DNA-binding transcriptional regulator [Rouxiella aceris]